VDLSFLDPVNYCNIDRLPWSSSHFLSHFTQHQTMCHNQDFVSFFLLKASEILNNLRDKELEVEACHQFYFQIAKDHCMPSLQAHLLRIYKHKMSHLSISPQNLDFSFLHFLLICLFLDTFWNINECLSYSCNLLHISKDYLIIFQSSKELGQVDIYVPPTPSLFLAYSNHIITFWKENQSQIFRVFYQICQDYF